MNRWGVALLIVVLLAVVGYLGLRLAKMDRSALQLAQMQAADAAAQTLLTNALADARICMSSSDNFDGCTPKALAGIDQAVIWVGNLPAKTATVSVDLAKGHTIVMSSLSTTGHAFCVSRDLAPGGLGTAYGRKDAVGATSQAGCGTPSSW